MKKTMAALALCGLLLMLPVAAGQAPEQSRDPAVTVPILMYHHIEEMEQYSNMTVSPERFVADMTFLQQKGFTPLLAEDLLAIRAGERPMPTRPVMITFDDGYRSNYTYMLPALEQTGMRATVALIAGMVCTEEHSAGQWTLSWEQCREMYQTGLVDFGSHTWNLHNPDNRLGLKARGPNGIQRLAGEQYVAYAQRTGDDLRQSIDMIEQHVGNTVRYFAYPFGKTDPWYGRQLISQGIAMAVTTSPGQADLAGDWLNLPRFRVDMGTPLSEHKALKPYLERDAQGVFQPGATETVAWQDGQAQVPCTLVDETPYVAIRTLADACGRAGLDFDVAWDADTGRLLLLPGVPYSGPAQPNGSSGRLLPVNTPVRAGDRAGHLRGFYQSGVHYYRADDVIALLGLSLPGAAQDMQPEQ